MAPHEEKNTLVCKNSKRIPPSNNNWPRVRQGFLPALKDGVSAQGAIG
jgi:hypothetical protein